MTLHPNIGTWYRFSGGPAATSTGAGNGNGELFEVVAFDSDDGTIEIQYFDGTIEEMDLEDWVTHCEDNELEAAEAPEDWSGSVDVEPEDGASSADDSDSERRLGARPLDGLDRFK